LAEPVEGAGEAIVDMYVKTKGEGRRRRRRRIEGRWDRIQKVVRRRWCSIDGNGGSKNCFKF